MRIEGDQAYLVEIAAEAEDGRPRHRIIAADKQGQRVRFGAGRDRVADARGCGFDAEAAELDVVLNGSRAVYVVEEVITGYPLRALLQNGPLTPTRCLVICEQVLRALAIVHGNGLVHRDIKPENIKVEPGDRVRVLDFGIARHLLLTSLTADAAAMGPLTPGYGAPEQIRNEKRSIGPRTDLFAWAVVFYECWTGGNPFVAGCMTPGQALGKTLTYDPPLLSTTPPSLAQLIQRCLNKPVHRRPPSVESVIAEFERLVGGVV
jgi:serine/threonine-protein kinase